MGSLLLAVETALSHPGGTPLSRTRIQTAGPAACGDGHRLFPLDTARRLALRSRTLAGSGWDGTRIGGDGSQVNGLDLADCQSLECKLSHYAATRPAHSHRTWPAGAYGLQ